jgi:hypothetical protein
MSNSLLNATEISVILNRRDRVGQIPWTEFRTNAVLVGGTAAQGGSIPLLDANGKLDLSTIPTSSGSTVSVDSTEVSNPNFNLTTPTAPSGYSNIIWQFDDNGNVSAYYATSGVVSVPFNEMVAGTNTGQTLIIGNGSILSFTGSGSNNANKLYGVAINSAAPAVGQVLTATSTTTAEWQTPPTPNLLQVTVDFGSDTGPITPVYDITTSVSAPWITNSSTLLCSVMGVETPQHGPDDGLFEGLTAQAENLVPGVGFTLHAYSPMGSWGKYVFAVVGA